MHKETDFSQYFSFYHPSPPYMPMQEESTENNAAMDTYPALYQTLLFHDADTPIDFVEILLESFFHLKSESLEHALKELTHTGKIICGTYTKDIAETKVSQVMEFTHQYEYPVECIIQKESDHAIKKS